jgi:hypothetical protein
MGQEVVVVKNLPMYNGQPIDGRGQVIELQYAFNDQKLLRHEYVRLLEKGEEVSRCKSCGLKFVGDSASGNSPYAAHLERARHDLEPIDLDSPAKSPSGRRRRTPDTGAASDDAAQDLELEGAPPPTKMEEERPRRTRVRAGG